VDIIDKCILGTCPDILELLPSEFVDLTVTSPPYDNLRSYQSVYNFEKTAAQLYRLTKPGGVLVWVVADSTLSGSESLNSMKQAIFFKEGCGFRCHDTMIYVKANPMPMTHNRYEQAWEYMFVFSKGKPKTFNPIKEPITSPRKVQTDVHHKNNYQRGNKKRGHNTEKIIKNVWPYHVGFMHCTKDVEAYEHPAIFPEKLAEDHVLSWSNAGDMVLDPFCGSGTTCKMAAIHGRRYLGIDCSEEYLEIARRRVAVITASATAT
jgi:site-specific DNA-methyltransferase (adenine-specific)